MHTVWLVFAVVTLVLGLLATYVVAMAGARDTGGFAISPVPALVVTLMLTAAFLALWLWA